MTLKIYHRVYTKNNTEVIRSPKSMKDRQYNGQKMENGQKDKQWSTKHYTESKLKIEEHQLH
jgi:hypothetical protein